MHNHRNIHMRGGERYPLTKYSTRNVSPTNRFFPYSYRPLHSQLSLSNIHTHLHTYCVPNLQGSEKNYVQRGLHS